MTMKWKVNFRQSSQGDNKYYDMNVNFNKYFVTLENYWSEISYSLLQQQEPCFPAK